MATETQRDDLILGVYTSYHTIQYHNELQLYVHCVHIATELPAPSELWPYGNVYDVLRTLQKKGCEIRITCHSLSHNNNIIIVMFYMVLLCSISRNAAKYAGSLDTLPLCLPLPLSLSHCFLPGFAAIVTGQKNYGH